MFRRILIPLNILPPNAPGSVISLTRQRISSKPAIIPFAAHRVGSRQMCIQRAGPATLHLSRHRIPRDDIELTIPRQLHAAGLRYVLACGCGPVVNPPGMHMHGGSNRLLDPGE
jgi:hypothetical protein